MRDWPWTWPRRFDLSISNFPHLIYGRGANHRRTSWATKRYNCIAWAADDLDQPWWPQSYDAYWPKLAIDDLTRDAFVSAFETLGYKNCTSTTGKVFEPGVEKIAIYFKANGEPTHAARQLGNGQWTSKLGDFPDIEHDQPEDVNCDEYGTPQVYMSRDRGTFKKSFFSRLLRRSRILLYWAVYFARSIAP